MNIDNFVLILCIFLFMFIGYIGKDLVVYNYCWEVIVGIMNYYVCVVGIRSVFFFIIWNVVFINFELV